MERASKPSQIFLKLIFSWCASTISCFQTKHEIICHYELNPNRAGLLSTRNTPGLGTLCQALYLKNYRSYDHETSQGGREQKTVEPKIFLATSDYPTSGYEGQRQIFLFLYKCSDFALIFCRCEDGIFTSCSNHVWEYVMAKICHKFLIYIPKK